AATPSSWAPPGLRMAASGRLPLPGRVVRARAGAGAAPGNSAGRVRALHDAFVVPDGLAGRVGQLGGPVLLVDDLIDSGWTAAVVGRLLRPAGAPAVLPVPPPLAGADAVV